MALIKIEGEVGTNEVRTELVITVIKEVNSIIMDILQCIGIPFQPDKMLTRRDIKMELDPEDHAVCFIRIEKSWETECDRVGKLSFLENLGGRGNFSYSGNMKLEISPKL
ncbi:delta gene product [Kotonkan virus]|uniref:Delta protein n=1 Tax=Kotonkan virus TaxID=318836 RepID=H8XWF9_9RHAB|nr:delta gene product [Kotonkan virus]AEI17639.1 delta protein [Kotonkan virus]